MSILAIIRDVTERTKAEEALHESELRMRQFYELYDLICIRLRNLVVYTSHESILKNEH